MEFVILSCQFGKFLLVVLFAFLPPAATVPRFRALDLAIVKVVKAVEA